MQQNLQEVRENGTVRKEDFAAWFAKIADEYPYTAEMMREIIALLTYEAEHENV